MADQFVRLTDDTANTGKRIDNTELTVNALAVQRQRITVAGSTDVSLAEVTNSTPTTQYGLVVRPIVSGTQAVSGTVTANAGTGPFPVSDNAGSLTVDNPILSVVGSGTEAAAQRVTIASDSTGVLSVDDNGSTLSIDDGAGSITIDGSVSITGALPAGTNNVGDFDVLSLPGSLAGKAEDAVAVTGDVGIVALAVRRDAASSGVDTDGDYAALSVDSVGALRVTGAGGGTQYNEADVDATITGTAIMWEDTSDTLRSVSAAKPLPVNIISGAGSGGTAMADEAAFTEGTTSFTPVGGVFNDTITSDPTEDQGAAARITAKRGLHVNLRNVAGTEVGTSGAPVRTDPTGTTTQPVSGTVTANAGTGTFTVSNAALSVVGAGAEATALRVTIANDSTGVVSVDDNGSTISIDDGAGSLTVDNAALAVTGGGVESGSLRVTIANDSTGVISIDDNGASITVDNATISVVGGGTEAAAQRVTIANDSTGVISIDDNGGTITVDGTVTVGSLPASTNTIEVVGDAAHDAAVAGNPILNGAEARDTLGTAVATGDVVRVNSDRYGRLAITGPEFVTTTVAATASGSTELVAAPGAGNHLRVYYLMSSSDSATATMVHFRDGTGGGNKYSHKLHSQGQAWAHNIKPGYWDLTTATGLFVNLGTAATSIYVTAETETVAD